METATATERLERSEPKVASIKTRRAKSIHAKAQKSLANHNSEKVEININEFGTCAFFWHFMLFQSIANFDESDDGDNFIQTL